MLRVLRGHEGRFWSIQAPGGGCAQLGAESKGSTLTCGLYRGILNSSLLESLVGTSYLRDLTILQQTTEPPCELGLLDIAGGPFKVCSHTFCKFHQRLGLKLGILLAYRRLSSGGCSKQREMVRRLSRRGQGSVVPLRDACVRGVELQ